MNVVENLSNEEHVTASQSDEVETETGLQKVVGWLLSILPWAIVGILLWAGIFVKPTATVQEVIPPAIDRRDNIYGITSVNPNMIWVAGNYGKVVRSEDGAQNWAIQETPTTQHLQDISKWDENRAVAVGNDGVVIITEDAGQTWVQVEAPKSEVVNKLLRVHAYPGGEAWAVGEMGMILLSTDYGKTWQRMREEEDVIMNDIAKVGDNTVWVVGEYGRVFWSEDNGQTWKDEYTDSPSSLMAVEFRSPTEAVIVGLDGVVLSSKDAGATWKFMDSGATGNREHLMDVQWSDELNQWVAVGNVGIWMRFDENLSEFETTGLSKTDLSAHTEMAIVDGGLFVVGNSVGYLSFDDNQWVSLQK